MNDPWTNEDDAENAAPDAASNVAVTKPNVYADPAIPTLVLPKPDVFTPPAPAQTTDPKSVLAEIDAVLPTETKDLMRGFAILRELEIKLPSKTPAEKAAKRTRISRVKKHLWNLQQLPVTDASPSQHQANLGKQISQGAAMRDEESEKLNAAIEAAQWESVAMTPTRKINPVIARAMQETEVCTAVALARSALANYKRAYFNHFAMAFPETRLKEIRFAISRLSDLETVKALNAESIELSSPHSRTVAHNVRVMLKMTFDEYCKPALVHLLNEAIACVESYKAEAVAKEKAFFGENGVASESTPLSRQFEPALNQLRHALNSIIVIPAIAAAGIPYAPNADETVLSHVFALSIL